MGNDVKLFHSLKRHLKTKYCSISLLFNTYDLSNVFKERQFIHTHIFILFVYIVYVLVSQTK